MPCRPVAQTTPEMKIERRAMCGGPQAASVDLVAEFGHDHLDAQDLGAAAASGAALTESLPIIVAAQGTLR